MKNDTSPRPPVKGRRPTRTAVVSHQAVPEPAKLVPAIERAAAVLDRIAEGATPLSLAALARELRLPKSSVHGICQTLCALRLLRQQDGGFVLDTHVLQWSQAFIAQSDVVREFHALLAADPRLGPHTVSLSTRDGADVVYLACRNGSAPLGFSFRVGMRLPAVFTATGKAMLAQLDDEAFAAALPQPWPASLTRHSVRNRTRLAGECATARTRGYAIDDGQVRDGMVCLGAAIVDRAGNPLAGLALSLTASEATPAILARTGAIIADLGRELSRRV